MQIDKYKIVVQDEFNLKLSMEVPKQKTVKGGEPKDGELSDKFIGYYSTLSGALQKISNIELKGLVDTNTLEDVLKAINKLESMLESKYGTRGFTKLNVGDEL